MTKDCKEVFTDIYARKAWGDGSGGGVESREFELHARGRKLRSLIVTEHYPANKA